MDDYNGKLVAVLTCTAGEVMEQTARNSLLESFGYERANDSLPNLWMPMTGDGDNDCAVEISDDGKIVRLFGDNDENIANLNGILRRIGWDDYDAQVIDNVIERRITHALASVLMRKCETLKESLSIDDIFAQFAPTDDDDPDRQGAMVSADPIHTASASVVTNIVAMEEERDGLISDLESIKRERDLLADKYGNSEKEVSRLTQMVGQLREQLRVAENRPAATTASASDLPAEVVREALTMLLSREFEEHVKGSRWAQALKTFGVLPRLQLADPQ